MIWDPFVFYCSKKGDFLLALYALLVSLPFFFHQGCTYIWCTYHPESRTNQLSSLQILSEPLHTSQEAGQEVRNRKEVLDFITVYVGQCANIV